MTWLFLKLGLGEQLAKILGIAVPIALAVGALLWLRADAYSDGVSAERGKWQAKAAEMAIVAGQLQRRADQLRQEREEFQRAQIARNRQEVDNAVRNIPDQAVSPRQHARACLELRRQGENPPACQSRPAR